MNICNIKPSDINRFKMAKGELEITSYSPKSQQVTVYKIHGLEIKEPFTLDKIACTMLKTMAEQKTRKFSVKVEGNTILIENDNSKYKGSLLDKVNIPELKEDDLVEVKVNLKALKKATKFTATSTTRPVLTGVQIIHQGIVACDSYKAYRYYQVGTSQKPYVIPVDFINAIESTEDEITLKLNDQYVLFENDDMKIYARLINGTLDMNKIFESTKDSLLGGSEFTIDAEALNREIKIMSSIMGNEKIVKFIVSGNKVKISTHMLANANYESELACGGSHDNVTLAMNIDLLKTVLSCHDGKKITFAYKNELSPIFVDGRDEFIILPVRI